MHQSIESMASLCNAAAQNEDFHLERKTKKRISIDFYIASKPIVWNARNIGCISELTHMRALRIILIGMLSRGQNTTRLRGALGKKSIMYVVTCIESSNVSVSTGVFSISS